MGHSNRWTISRLPQHGHGGDAYSISPIYLDGAFLQNLIQVQNWQDQQRGHFLL